MTETENPIDNDDRLKGLLSAIPEVKSKKAYIAWRKSFLKIYTKHLDPNGILNGKDSNYRLLKQLRALSLRIADAESLLASKSDAAASSNSSSAAAMTTIEGRRVLTNLTEEVAASETKVNEFMPKTNADEEKFGFDKFELAAVLLEDGFHGYDRMKETKDALEQITSGLVGNNNNETSGDGSSVSVVDDNFQKIIRNYSNAVQSFLEVMEDLGLFSVVKQCVDVAYQGKERPEPQDPALSVPEEQDDESSGEGSLGDGSTTYSSSSDGSDGNSQSASEDGGPEDGQKKKKKKKEKSESSKKKKKTKGIKGGEETLPGGNNNNNSNGEEEQRLLPILDDPVLDDESWPVLGKGAGGVTRKATWKGREVAVKTFAGELTSDGSPRDEKAVSEMLVLANNDNGRGSDPALIELLGETKEKGALVMEFLENYGAVAGPPSMESCSRDVYDESSLETLQDFPLWKIVVDTLRVLSKLHSLGITHADFYAHNILIRQQRQRQPRRANSGTDNDTDNDTDASVKVSDFGAAYRYRHHENNPTNDNDEFGRLVETVEIRAFGVLVRELFGAAARAAAGSGSPARDGGGCANHPWEELLAECEKPTEAAGRATFRDLAQRFSLRG
mmetsp:Transcript_20303/g.42242  ORF Transcript_20303/g.42242 Transcript_20303/m.42242 type:complete len:617 (-) Transcript_20303:2269-4119(-)